LIVGISSTRPNLARPERSGLRQIEKTRKPAGTAHQPAQWVFYQTPSDKVVIGAGYEEKASRGESVSATADYQSLAEVVLICLSPGRVKRGAGISDRLASKMPQYILLVYISEVRMETAKLFWSGRSQAVRLPKDFRFKGDEVRIRRHGNAVIIEPMNDDWAWLDAIAHTLDKDFVQAAEEQPEAQERPEIDELFR
jgi:antitoxin VapB